MSRPEISTVGHSNRSFAEFLEILRAQGIEQIVDVRSVPRSRHNPQFNKSALGPALRARGINYRHMKILGGLRRARKDSPNTGWRNASFRGYADYIQTPDFRRGINALKVVARRKKTAIMCAEAVPWRCHRSLIGDWFVKMEGWPGSRNSASRLRRQRVTDPAEFSLPGWRVLDIISKSPARPHRPTPFARKRNGLLFYA